MNSHYLITFGLSGPSQPDLIQALRTLGADSIQTSKGLCVSTKLSIPELERELDGRNLRGTKISELAGEQEPDVAAFVGKAKS